MGQFSWICSDTKRSLICFDIRSKKTCTKKAFLLIPKEFGGGSYKVDHNYDGYGDFYDKDGNEVDAYEVLAKWNGVSTDNIVESRSNAINLYYTPKDNKVSQYKKGNYNNYGIMKYPLKIVENECAYEDAEPCWDDPNQGWG